MFDNVTPTKTQLNQFERGYMESVKLNTANIKEIIFALDTHPTIENILYSYITGKGQYEDYSPSYLKKHYNISGEIKQYKGLEREDRKALEEAIYEHHRAESRAKEEAEMERYRERARALVRDGDIDTIARALKTEAHQYDGVDPRFI